MKRTTSTQLFMDSSRRVTRYQIKQIKRTFPFLLLPAELRNIIYTYSIDLGTIERFFDQVYEKVLSTKNPRRQNVAPRMTTPTVFLLNKQIYQEASYLLQKDQSISFSHGLLNVDTLSSVVSPNILRSITSIEITDSGHPIIKGCILPTSWSGYMKILAQLGDVLSAGPHQLKKLTIGFQDERLDQHMTHCFDANYSCGFRDQMSKALQSLHKVRGISEVVLKGLNASEAKKLKLLMEKAVVGFFTLPRELRDMVYQYTMDWSKDCSKSLDRSLASWANKKTRFPFPKRTTPTVLLLSKQARDEALKVLRSQPLIMDFPGNHSFAAQVSVPSILGFISRGAVKQAKTIVFNMESWEWMLNFDRRLIAALSASEHLENFHLTFKDALKPSFMLVATQCYPDGKIHDSLKGLATIRGLKRVTFSGDLPTVYTEPLVQIMTSTPSASQVLPTLKAIQGNGEVIDAVVSEDDDAMEE